MTNPQQPEASVPLEPTTPRSTGEAREPVTPPEARGPVRPASLPLRGSEHGPALGQSFYDSVGGSATFEKLVSEFYRGVADDPVLKPMYAEEDLGPAARRLQLFLEQYWGGPGTYSAERGHPRLRMRHLPFKVNPDARDRWLAHMRAAVDTLELPPLAEETLWDYLQRAAFAMVNTFED
jgi:hemoglobin